MFRLVRRRCRLAIATLAVLATVLLHTSKASAQGTGGTFASPISSKELMDYGRRLNLSESQYLAMESMHDAYKSRFRILRDGDIAVFLREQRAVQGGIPPIEKIESLLNDLDRIQGKIKALDDGLFDRLAPILGESQQALVPRIRLARERTRHGVLQATVSYGRGIADVSQIVFDLKLPAEAAQTADDALRPYERKLTRLMQELTHAFTRMTLNTMEALEERGFIDLSQEELFADPELIKKLVEEMRVIYSELSAGMVELNGEVNRLNMRTYRQIAASLSDADAQRLRNAFYRRAYRELGAVVALAEQDWMSDALAMKTLTDEQRDAISSVNANWQRHIDRLLEAGVDVVDDFWRNFSPYDVNPDRGTEFQASLTKITEEAQELRDRSEAELDQILGEEAITQIRRDAAQHAAQSSHRAAAAAAPDPEAPQEEAFVFSGDRFIPPPISEGDVKRYAERLELDEISRETIFTLHADYRGQYDNLQSVNDLKAANVELRAIDTKTGDNTEARTATVTTILASRRQAFVDIAAADAGFFDDAMIIITEEKHRLIEQIRNRRLRRLYSGSTETRYALGKDYSAEAGVDVTAIVAEEVERSDLRDVRDDLETILAEHEQQTIAALSARLEAQLELEATSERWATDVTKAAREDIARVITVQQEYDKRIAQIMQKVAAANAAVIALNREALAAIVDAADAAGNAEAAEAIRTMYDRRAYPSVFKDAGAVHDQLQAALALTDLSSPQREQIEALSANYRAEYEKLSNDMKKDMDTAPISVVGMGPDRVKDWMERQSRLTRLRYDRSELNARMISRLTFILRPGQIERIGGLPEITEQAADNPYLR